MNKYAAMGLALEAATEAKRIIVVVPRQNEVRDTLAILEQNHLVQDQATIRRTNGNERIDFNSGGSILIRSPHQSLHGYAPDTIYVEEDVPRHILTGEQWTRYREDAALVLNSRRGELVIAH